MYCMQHRMLEINGSAQPITFCLNPAHQAVSRCNIVINREDPPIRDYVIYEQPLIVHKLQVEVSIG